MNSIFTFDGDYRFLSNFYILPEPILINGISYNTSEAAYQASKSIDRNDRRRISEMTPGKSKREGKKLNLRGDWLEVRRALMMRILRAKFQIPSLKKMLISTYPHILIEGNNWHDNYWGYHLEEGQEITGYESFMLCTPECPHNHLGKILMRIREELLDDKCLVISAITELQI